MIPVDSLLYKIDQKLNKLSSNSHQQIALEDKILSLNEAQLKLIKQKIDSNNTLKGGMDAFKKRYEDLQKLVENYIDHPLDLVLEDAHLNKWHANIGGISPGFMFYVDAYIIADKGHCKNRIIYINTDLAKHSDITILLNNNNYKPSFEYQETFSVISSDQIGIFTDGTFTPKKLYLSYVRYPKYIDKEGYIKLDGNASVNQDSELKNYLEDESVDLTVQALAMYTDNPTAAEAAQVRISTNE